MREEFVIEYQALVSDYQRQEKLIHVVMMRTNDLKKTPNLHLPFTPITYNWQYD